MYNKNKNAEGFIGNLKLDYRLIPDDTLHKGTTKRHKQMKNHPFYGARFSINIWNYF